MFVFLLAFASGFPVGFRLIGLFVCVFCCGGFDVVWFISIGD